MPPQGFPSKKWYRVRRGVPDPSRPPKCAPPERGVAYFRSFGFITGGTEPRPVTASARSHRVPSPSDLNVTPRPPPRLASRRSPGLPEGELWEGPGTLAKAMGPTRRSLTSRGEWLPPKRNTRGRRLPQEGNRLRQFPLRDCSRIGTRPTLRVRHQRRRRTEWGRFKFTTLTGGTPRGDVTRSGITR